MTLEIRKARAERAKIRAALHGVPGSGKTLGALLFARGLVGPEGRICVIDTERSRSEQYDRHPDYELGEFDVLQLDPPHTPERFLEALKVVYAQAYDAAIVDSLSHEWAGAGGVLENVDANKARGGNNFTAWNGPSQDHQRVIAAIVSAPCHIVVTLRAKTAYEIVEDDGKKKPRKIGLAPVAREGTEYELDLVVDVDQDHAAHLSKCNTRWARRLAEALAQDPHLTVGLGAAVARWNAESPAKGPATAPTPPAAVQDLRDELAMIGSALPDELAKIQAFLARNPSLAALQESKRRLMARLEKAKTTPVAAGAPSTTAAAPSNAAAHGGSEAPAPAAKSASPAPGTAELEGGDAYEGPDAELEGGDVDGPEDPDWPPRDAAREA